MHLDETNAIVDEKHRDKLSEESWGLTGRGYLAHYEWDSTLGKVRYVYSMHRRVWELEYGEPAPKNIDHINRNRLDNRVENLRPATPTLQALNMRSGKPDRELPKGVFLSNGHLVSSISFRGKSYHLGTFKTPEDASACYEAHRAALMNYEAAVARGEEVPPPCFVSPARKRRGRGRVSRSLVLELHGTGATVREIAEGLSVHPATVRNCLKEMGLFVPSKGGRPKKSLPSHSGT